MKIVKAAAVASSLLILAAAGFAPKNDGVQREGSAARITVTSEMELKPFPAQAWSELKDWTNGDPITAESIDGKPVLILTWSSWYRQTHSALRVAQRMHEQYGKDGLIVIGAHHSSRFENAADIASRNSVTFPFAHDASDGFRAAIQSTKTDFYVIDRGNLRFADIETSRRRRSGIVVRETKQQAAEYQERSHAQQPTRSSKQHAHAQTSTQSNRANATTFRSQCRHQTLPERQVARTRPTNRTLAARHRYLILRRTLALRPPRHTRTSRRRRFLGNMVRPMPQSHAKARPRRTR